MKTHPLNLWTALEQTNPSLAHMTRRPQRRGGHWQEIRHGGSHVSVACLKQSVPYRPAIRSALAGLTLLLAAATASAQSAPNIGAEGTLREASGQPPSPGSSSSILCVHTNLGLTPPPALTNGPGTAVIQVGDDWEAKAGCQSISPRDVLAKLVALPINTWIRTNAPSKPPGGLAPEDRAMFFVVGHSDPPIATDDANSLAFVAIQGLYQLLQDKESEIASLKHQLTLLQNRLAAVESAAKQWPTTLGQQSSRAPSAPTGLRAVVIP